MLYMNMNINVNSILILIIIGLLVWLIIDDHKQDTLDKKEKEKEKTITTKVIHQPQLQTYYPWWYNTSYSYNPMYNTRPHYGRRTRYI